MRTVCVGFFFILVIAIRSHVCNVIQAIENCFERITGYKQFQQFFFHFFLSLSVSMRLFLKILWNKNHTPNQTTSVNAFLHFYLPLCPVSIVLLFISALYICSFFFISLRHRHHHHSPLLNFKIYIIFLRMRLFSRCTFFLLKI